MTQTTRQKHKQPKHTQPCEEIRDFYSHFGGHISLDKNLQETKKH